MQVDFWGEEFRVNMILGCIGGFLVAVMSSMLGFGGGAFMVPFMTVALRLPMFLVVGSSLLAIFFNTMVSSIQHYRFGNFDWVFFCTMFPAALIGGGLALQCSKYISPIVAKRIAVIGLMIIAASLLGVLDPVIKALVGN